MGCWEAIADSYALIGSIWLDQDLGYVWVVATQIFSDFFPAETWGFMIQFDCIICFQMGWWKTTDYTPEN